jgi:hypothetical protein
MWKLNKHVWKELRHKLWTYDTMFKHRSRILQGIPTLPHRGVELPEIPNSESEE